MYMYIIYFTVYTKRERNKNVVPVYVLFGWFAGWLAGWFSLWLIAWLVVCFFVCLHVCPQPTAHSPQPTAPRRLSEPKTPFTEYRIQLHKQVTQGIQHIFTNRHKHPNPNRPPGPGPMADRPQPTAHSPRPTAHGPQPTAHSPQPTAHTEYIPIMPTEVG